MPKQELARDRQNGPRIQKVIDWLYGGHIPIDPAQAPWDDAESGAPIFTYYNYLWGRFEWGRGKIPGDVLWEYEQEAGQWRQ